MLKTRKKLYITFSFQESTVDRSLAAPEFVKIATSGADGDAKFVKIKTIRFWHLPVSDEISWHFRFLSMYLCEKDVSEMH